MGAESTQTQRDNFNKFQQESRRTKNVNKHLRIALATSGHERAVHMRKAEELASKYWPLGYKSKVPLLNK